MAGAPQGTRIQLGSRATVDVMLQRVSDAQRFLSQALPYEVAVRKMCDKWGIKESTARMYIAKARSAWKDRPVLNAEEKRIELLNSFQLYYNECMAKGAYASAGRALREMGLLSGLYPDKYSALMAVPDDERDIRTSDPDRLRERMGELLKKHAPELARIRDSAQGGEAA